jgi:hypothetical protein
MASRLTKRLRKKRKTRRRIRRQKGGDRDGFQSDVRTVEYYTPKSRGDYGEIDDVGRLGAKVV